MPPRTGTCRCGRLRLRAAYRRSEPGSGIDAVRANELDAGLRAVDGIEAVACFVKNQVRSAADERHGAAKGGPSLCDSAHYERGKSMQNSICTLKCNPDIELKLPLNVQ